MDAAKTPAVTAPSAPNDDIDKNVSMVGQAISQLRRLRGWSLKELGERTDLSPSFLSAVERGGTDISLRRLARIASALDHSVATLLGYTERTEVFHYTSADEVQVIDRGEGVYYDVRRSPNTEMEMIHATLEPGSEFSGSMTHMGIDTILVLEGKIEVIVNHRPYPLDTGQSGSYTATHPHTLRNPYPETAQIVAVTTEQTFFAI